MKPCRFLVFLLLTLCFSLRAFADDCDPNDPTLIKPDLVAEPETHVRVVRQNDGHRWVIFTTSIGNVGQGPLLLKGTTVDNPDPTGPPQVTQATQIVQRTDGTTCTHFAGYFIYHPTHRHWHFDDFTDYVLRKDDPFTGPIVAQSDKISFCLIDLKQLPGFFTPITFSQDCLQQEGIQGIDVGFADVYDSFLAGQDIDLDADPANPVPPGSYFLVNTANPRKVIIESDDTLEDNSAVVPVSVALPSTVASGPPSDGGGGSSGGSTGGGSGGTPPPRSPHSPSSPHAPTHPPRPPAPLPPPRQVHSPHTPSTPAGPVH